MKPSVKYSAWFKREASKLAKMRRDVEALKIEHQSVVNDIEDAEEYREDLEKAITEFDKLINTTRRELARRFATYDTNFRHDVMLDPSLLD